MSPLYWATAGRNAPQEAVAHRTKWCGPPDRWSLHPSGWAAPKAGSPSLSNTIPSRALSTPGLSPGPASQHALHIPHSAPQTQSDTTPKPQTLPAGVLLHKFNNIPNLSDGLKLSNSFSCKDRHSILLGCPSSYKERVFKQPHTLLDTIASIERVFSMHAMTSKTPREWGPLQSAGSYQGPPFTKREVQATTRIIGHNRHPSRDP